MDTVTEYHVQRDQMNARDLERVNNTYTGVSGASYANVDMPWRCLCLGFAVHNTYTRPRRLTVLQNSHIFLTDDLTFMITITMKQSDHLGVM